MQNAKLAQWLKVVSYIGIYGGLLMPVFFWPIVIFPFVYSKLAFFQVLIGLTFPAYLVLAWIEPKYRPRWSSSLYLAIVAYFVAVAASVIFSVDPSRSWWGNQERMNGLFTLLHFFAWLTMAIGIIKTWPQWRRLLQYQIVLSGFMACVALLQKPFPNLLKFPAGPRVGGLLDNPIYMGAYQIFNLFFIALLWLKGPTTRTQKIWYSIVAAIDVAAFVAAQSRGALLGLGVGVIVFAIAYAAMTPNKKVKKIAFAGIICAVLGYGLLFAMRGTEFIKNSPLARFTNFSGATHTRLIAWDIAWKGFLDRPLTGWGFDAFHILFNEKYNPESLRYGYYETWFDRSHNTIMDVLAMTGVFGFVTFVAIFVALFWSVIRAHRRGWIDAPVTSVLIALPIAYFVQNLFVFDHPAAFSMSYLMYALVIGATSSGFLAEHSPAPSAASKRSNAPLIALGILQLAMVVVIWNATIRPVRASILSIKSNSAFAQGRYEDAFKLAKEAAAIPTPYLEEQTFLQSRNFITLAGSSTFTQLPYWREWHDLVVSVTERHLADHGNNVHPWFIFARFLETLAPHIPENAARAEQAYLQAIALSPKRQQLYYGLSRFYLLHGRHDEALALMKDAVSFDSEVGESRWLLGIHLFFDRQQREEGAREILAAFTAKTPYEIRDAKEVVALARAYETVNDQEGLKKLMNLLPTLPQADTSVYMEIAKIMERNGLLDERNRIVGALVKIDTDLANRLSPLLIGNVTSIQAALDETANDVSTESLLFTSDPAEAPSPSGGPGPRAR